MFYFFVCRHRPLSEYQTLKLMQLSISKVNDVCQSLLDNLQLDKLIPSPPVRSPPLYSAKGIKNTRRHMEDRHIIIDDFNSIFNVMVSSLMSLNSPDHRFQMSEKRKKEKNKLSALYFRTRIKPVIMQYSMGMEAQMQLHIVYHIYIVKSWPVNIIRLNRPKLYVKLFSKQMKNS